MHTLVLPKGMPRYAMDRFAYGKQLRMEKLAGRQAMERSVFDRQ